MIQTIFVYSNLIMFMLYLAYVGREKKEWKYMVYAVIVYSIIFGMRYGVGMDFFAYKNDYDSYITSNGKWGGIGNFEIGFIILTSTIAKLNFHSAFYFGIIAFIQVYFSFLAIKNTPKLYSALIFTFMLGCSWLSYSNGLRQIISVGFWLYSIKYIAERNAIKHYLILILALLFHTSTLILLPIYPLYHYRNNYFNNIKIQLLLLFFAIIMMKVSIIQSLFIQLDSMMDILNYSDYKSATMLNQVEDKTHIGLGFIITLVINITLIINSNKIKDHFHNQYLTICYDIFVIGITLKYIFTNSLLFSRLNYFFDNTNFIIAAFSLVYFSKANKKLYYYIGGLYLLTFIANLYRAQDNTALFVFCFQDDLFYLKNH